MLSYPFSCGFCPNGNRLEAILSLTEPNKMISLQERVYRKRKLKSMVFFLTFLLSRCTVERSVWQRQRSSAWFEFAYETFFDNEWFENFRVSSNTMYTAFLSLGHLAFSKLNCIVSSGKISIYASTSSSFHPEEESAAMLKSTTFLSPEPHGFFSAHAISEIVTQTDVRIKKRVRTRGFSGFGAIDVYSPKTRKNTGPCPSPKTWYGLFTRAKMWGPYFFFDKSIPDFSAV